MKLKENEFQEIFERLISLHPEYKVKAGEPYYKQGYDAYLFSSHNFIAHYRAQNQDDYALLLNSCRHSRIGQDRAAHGQIASCLGRYAKKNPQQIRPIGRRVSRDVHDNIVYPMWWVYYGRLI